MMMMMMMMPRFRLIQRPTRPLAPTALYLRAQGCPCRIAGVCTPIMQRERIGGRLPPPGGYRQNKNGQVIWEPCRIACWYCQRQTRSKFTGIAVALKMCGAWVNNKDTNEKYVSCPLCQFERDGPKEALDSWWSRCTQEPPVGLTNELANEYIAREWVDPPAGCPRHLPPGAPPPPAGPVPPGLNAPPSPPPAPIPDAAPAIDNGNHQQEGMPALGLADIADDPACAVEPRLRALEKEVDALKAQVDVLKAQVKAQRDLIKALVPPGAAAAAWLPADDGTGQQPKGTLEEC